MTEETIHDIRLSIAKLWKRIEALEQTVKAHSHSQPYNMIKMGKPGGSQSNIERVIENWETDRKIYNKAYENGKRDAKKEIAEKLRLLDDQLTREVVNHEKEYNPDASDMLEKLIKELEDK